MSCTRLRPTLSRHHSRLLPYANVACLQHKCRYSSIISPAQESPLNTWITQTLPVTKEHNDFLSASKLADLFCTLPTRSHTSQTRAFAPGASLSPLHTLVFFYPRSTEDQLGTDKTDREFCPPEPFTRRMWAGGTFRFTHNRTDGSSNGLQVGREATARVKIPKVEKKGFEKGSPMVFVHQNIDYAHKGEEEPLVSEERIHVYLPREMRANSRVAREVTGLPKLHYTFSWTPSPTTLFRFSALTWNGHLIHLDPEYAQNEEGYPERLVHGPLTALMLVEALYHEGYSGRIDNFVYRARNPTLVNRRQHLRGAFSLNGDSAILWAEDDDGVVGMTGTVDLLDPVSSKFS
ncbi:uncharacterized protein FOMMEDRAFT_21048 [Fomitiporia mediterranea MF3/22]|uniref:uncharacterized protein n=1 Tax=Fomitiporia mediterranea (strain MF3/22) TaxID=694068 RepID=UPI0004407827|nr:uncharacterized protein FOMMEDRAFT_21048 [Fomitiporia mediterranea MF3/22]EJD02294.1 hypothetical protein FOMMEDRAFT_21048 [Fomitiporia mediterranea MF3/22]